VLVIAGRALSRIRRPARRPVAAACRHRGRGRRLIAEQREARPGEHPLLFQLLNEMDGSIPPST